MPPAKKYPPAGGWPSDNCVPSPPPRESLDIKLEVGVTARSGKPADGAHITIDLAAGSSTEVKEEHTEPRPPAATRKRKAPVALTPPDEHVWLPVGGPVPDREHAKNVVNADLQSNGGWHCVVSGTGRSKLGKFISVDGRTGTKELSSISSIFMTHSPTHPFSRLHPSLPHSCIHESIHPWMHIHELTCGTDQLICHRWGVQGSRRLLEE